ncbi:MAG: hypothetical protein OIN85_04630 [Candidatus Methanoperedens sp.]|nr:hypothetical protein [Candidatus Methanoperedens sp.]
MIRGKIIFIASIVIVSLIISGCVSAPPGATPTPAPTPVPTTAVPTATPTPGATVAIPSVTPSVPPAIKVTSYPPGVNGEANFTIQWEVAGGTTGNISQTGVQWGYSANYTRNSTVLNGKTPQKFSVDLIAPAGGGPIYFRVYATVDGVDIYSPGYQIAINPRYTGGGGGY